MLAMKNSSLPFSLIIGPPKSIWISSFGSVKLDRGDPLLRGITDFKFLPISVQALHSLALASISRWIQGHQNFWAREHSKTPWEGVVDIVQHGILNSLRESCSFIYEHPCLTLKQRL